MAKEQSITMKLVMIAVLVFLLNWLSAHIGSAAGFEWQAGAGHRSARLLLPPTGKTGFKLMPPEATGIFFTNRLALERSLTNQIYLNGSGVTAGDCDGDGWCDLYFCGLDGGNALYRNLGNWKFQDIPEA